MDLEDSITQTQIEPIEDEVLPCRRAEGMSNEPPDEEHWGKLICHTDEEETTNSDTCTIAVLYPNIIYLKRKESNVSKPGALNEIMLGRSSSCEVVINDKRISSQHCRLYCIPSVAGEGEHIRTLGVFIEDMSSNGTWVNTYTHLSKRKVGMIGLLLLPLQPFRNYYSHLCKDLTDFLFRENKANGSFIQVMNCPCSIL